MISPASRLAARGSPAAPKRVRVTREGGSQWTIRFDPPAHTSRRAATRPGIEDTRSRASASNSPDIRRACRRCSTRARSLDRIPTCRALPAPTDSVDSGCVETGRPARRASADWSCRGGRGTRRLIIARSGAVSEAGGRTERALRAKATASAVRVRRTRRYGGTGSRRERWRRCGRATSDPRRPGLRAENRTSGACLTITAPAWG